MVPAEPNPNKEYAAMETKQRLPFSLSEEERVLEEKVKTLKIEAIQAESRAQDLKTQAREAEESHAVVKALSTSWDNEDPGKYDVASWLLTRDGRECVAREFLPAGTPVYTDKEQWEEFLAAFAASRNKRFVWELHGKGHPYGAVPPWYPVVPLEDTLHAPCPACGAERPVIMAYEQTDDGPDGDTWTKRRFVLCCRKLTPIGKPECSSARF